MSERPQVCYIADRGFERCSLVSLASLLSTSARPLDVTLFLQDTTEWALGRIAALQRTYATSAITVRDLPHLGFSEYRGQISEATLARLYLPDLMSGRVLLLDGDTLVRRDLSHLFDMEMGAALIAGVKGEYFWRNRLAAERARVGLAKRYFAKEAAKTVVDDVDLGAGYINAGVIMFDIDRISGGSEASAMRDIATARRYRFRDQDHLNLVFQGKIALLPPEYNAMWGNPATKAWPYRQAERSAFATSREDPVVLHFVGPKKPWITRGGFSRNRRRWTKEWRAAHARLEALG